MFRRGQAEGIIVGGNLGTLLLLVATEYMPDLDGKILFVEEDEDETPMTVDRLFTQLRHVGAFGRIAGLVIGRFPASVGFSDQDSLTMILDEALAGYDVPVLYDVDFGHGDPIFTFPIGGRCRLDASNRTLRLLPP